MGPRQQVPLGNGGLPELVERVARRDPGTFRQAAVRLGIEFPSADKMLVLPAMALPIWEGIWAPKGYSLLVFNKEANIIFR